MGPSVELVGILAVAAILAFRYIPRRRSATERRLAAFGFEPCESEAPSLERAWRTITGSDAARELHVVGCRSRIAGLSMVHHFTVREETAQQQPGRSEPSRPAAYPAYLFNLRNAALVCRGAVTLQIAPLTAKINGQAAVQTVELDDSRPTLEIGAHSWSASIIAAHGDKGGKLDDLIPEDIQEKIVRAAEHGFSIIHLGNGKAAFAARSSHEDVEDQIGYLAEWL
jgi:hypothetical protein